MTIDEIYQAVENDDWMIPLRKQALENGVVDKSYDTVRYGRVNSYQGEAIVTDANGKQYKAIGHKVRGSAGDIYSYGSIEIIPLSDRADAHPQSEDEQAMYDAHIIP
jgi:hypothetical protein